jgi:hypothetical protein
MTTWSSVDTYNRIVPADITTVDPTLTHGTIVGWHIIPDALAGDPVALAAGLVLAADGVTVQVSSVANYAAAWSATLTATCAGAITGGFTSSALGTPHTYPNDPTSQTNLMGSVLASMLPGVPATWTTAYWCMDTAGSWAFQPHTIPQIQQAGADGKAWVLGCQTQLATMRSQAAAATTIAQIQAIVWTPPTIS